MKVRWKKGLFSNTYTMYSNGEQLGTLEDKFFSQTAIGKFEGNEYTFKTKGLFNQTTEIIDNKSKKIIGTITYNNFLSKATIIVNNETFIWKYDNAWHTRWSMSKGERELINSKNSSTTGEIETKTDSALTIVSGLFVTNFYQKMMVVVLFIIFIPIWINTLN